MNSSLLCFSWAGPGTHLQSLSFLLKWSSFLCFSLPEVNVYEHKKNCDIWTFLMFISFDVGENKQTNKKVSKHRAHKISGKTILCTWIYKKKRFNWYEDWIDHWRGGQDSGGWSKMREFIVSRSRIKQSSLQSVSICPKTNYSSRIDAVHQVSDLVQIASFWGCISPLDCAPLPSPPRRL